MKITTDVNYAGSRPAGGVTARTRVSNAKAESDRAFAESFSAKLQRDRAIADALAIAQSSRQIIQKAIDASYRMRSIAFEAMTTGRVNMDQLNVEVAGIQRDFAVYGENITIPVDQSTSGAGRTAEVLNSSIQKLGAQAGEMQAGRKVNPEVFNSIAADLKPLVDETDKSIAAYASQFAGARLSGGATDYVKLNSSTAGLITGNPVAGINAQGNLSSDLAGILATA